MTSEEDIELLASMEQEFEESDEANTQVFTDEMMLRRFVWSIVPCEDAVSVLNRYPLPVVSDEVETAEHDQAHFRLEELGPLNQVIAMFATQAASVIREANLDKHNDDPQVDAEMATVKMLPVIFAASRAIIAEMVDIGLLHLGPSPFGVDYDEEEDDAEDNE